MLSPRAGFRVAAILLLSVCVRQPSQLVAQEASAPDAPQTVRVPRELSVPGSSAPASPADRTASDTLAADLLAQARELRRQGNPRDAYALYRRWLEQNSGSPDYGAVLAEAASCAPDVVLSVELYRRYGSGVADGRLREQLLVEQARLLAAAGQLEDAMQLLAAPGTSTERLYLKGVLLYEQGELEKCLDTLREALADRVLASRAEGTGAEGEGAFAPRPEEGERAGDPLFARIYYMMAQAYAGLDRTGEAESLYLLLQKRFGTAPIAPAVYLAYAELLARLGRSTEATAVAQELRRLFPESPEASLLESSATVTYAQTPLRLLPPGAALRGQSGGIVPPTSADAGGAVTSGAASLATAPATVPAAISGGPAVPAAVTTGAAGPAERVGQGGAPPERTTASAAEPPGTPSDGATPARPAGNPAVGAVAPPGAASLAAVAPAAVAAPAARALVQTGSYRDPENARYMVRDLKAAGFAAEIREATLDGKTFHRVVIGPPMTQAEAETVMLRLKDAGFEGFLLLVE